MITITLSTFTHKNSVCTGIHFPYSFEVKEFIKAGPFVIWTQTHACFYIVRSTKANRALTNYLEAGGFKVVTKRTQKATALKQVKLKNKLWLSNEKKVVFQDFKYYLKGKRFSANTIKTYSNFVFDFLALARLPKAETDSGWIAEG